MTLSYLHDTYLLHTQESVSQWLEAEVNVLKFDYLLTVSACPVPSTAVLEDFVSNALKLYHLAAQLPGENYVAAYLAILGLLHLHAKAPEPPRYLLQAAMLARHLLADDAGKQRRAMVLLSTRLHLNLGLGTIAFQQYTYARIKEMLHESVSWILLSRISQTHPFEVQGPKGFSAEAEMSRVVGTIQRMENKTSDFLYTDLQNFNYDKALELQDFKQKLRCSLTKHLCVIELRRAARLRGDPIDQAPSIHWSSKCSRGVALYIRLLYIPRMRALSNLHQTTKTSRITATSPYSPALNTQRITQSST